MNYYARRNPFAPRNDVKLEGVTSAGPMVTRPALARRGHAGSQTTNHAVYPTPPTMQRFVDDHQRQFARPMFGNTHVNKFMSRHHLQVQDPQHSPVNVTYYSGGSFFVPPQLLPQYWHNFAADIEKDQVNYLQEMADGETTFALELDWRWDEVEHVPQHHEQAVATAHMVVVEYLNEHPKLEALVFTRAPGPKYVGSEKRWKVATGVHVLYNVRVTVQDGAQITHAVRDALLQTDPVAADGVDNIYVKHGAYVKRACLRPPYSGKDVPCSVCNDPVTRHLPVTPSPQFIHPVHVDCGNCDGRGTVIDSNVYTLAYVLNAAGHKDEVRADHLRAHKAELLSIASVLSTGNSGQRARELDHRPRFTLKELRATTLPPITKAQITTENKALHQRHEAQLAAMPSGKKVKVKDILREQCDVLTKRLKGRNIYQLLPNQDIEEAVLKVLPSISEHYADCRVRRACLYAKVALVVELCGGKGATYCKNLKEFHNSNRARLFFIEDGRVRTYAGCWSERCANKVVRTSCHMAHVRQLLDTSRRLAQGVVNAAPMRSVPKRKSDITKPHQLATKRQCPDLPTSFSEIKQQSK